jgi:hypothetical protein
LPEPVKQHEVYDSRGHLLTRADFAYVTPKRILVCADGLEFHSAIRQRIHDTRQSNQLQTEGWQVLRFLGPHVHRNPADCVTQLRKGGVRAMLRARPELVNMDMGEDEHRAIHYAVMNRSPEMRQLLMQCGADAHKGIYPHREATSALTIGTERGYDDIVAIIREAEQRRRETHAGGGAAATPKDLFCIDTWQSRRALEILRADPALIHSVSPDGATPLHAAACVLHAEGVAWLLDHGADPNRRAHGT